MRRIAIVFVASLLTWSCAGATAPNNGDGENSETNNMSNSSSGGCEDLDGDGFDGRNAQCSSGRDCDDRSAQVNPDAEEKCGDRKDNNCNSQIDEDCDGMMECIDNDGDRYGEGPGCFGEDCDDNNPVINPSAMEICGDDIDQDCDDMDLECPTNCTDEDGDGYGAPGSTDCTGPDGEVNEEIDCDDDNADIHPGADEVCDGVDNNCNDMEDECPLEGQSCTEDGGGECKGGLGVQCENDDDCTGDNVTCDTNSDPKICLSGEGGDCGDDDDCVEGLTCGADDTCTGNFCDPDPCTGNSQYDVCDREAARCVECPHFESDTDVQDAACDDGLWCATGGWCGEDQQVFRSSVDLGHNTTDEIFWTSVALAECWNDVRPDGDKALCHVFFVAGDVDTVVEQATQDAYLDGDLDAALFPEENEALDDIWGEGLFNRKEIDWKEDLSPGSEREICLWYQPGGGLLSGETLVLDKCENFAP